MSEKSNRPLELGLASTVALAATKTAAGTSAYVRNAAYSASIRGHLGNVGSGGSDAAGAANQQRGCSGGSQQSCH